jgi:hypothetical protein
MKKLISTITMTVFMMIGLGMHTASAQEMSAKKVQRLDRKMTKKSAHKKQFRTQKEYLSMKKRGHAPKRRVSSHRKARDIFDSSGRKQQRRYVEEEVWYRDSWSFPRGPRQRAYRNFKRGWYLAYRYDRASFYDRYGYEYGYFNRYGYYFDGIFYGYDRYYGYNDRIRGRGLFDGKYYMPADASRYGFCQTRQRTYPRPFRR